MVKKFNNSLAGLFFIMVGIAIARQIPSIRVMKVAMDSKLLPQICTILLIGFGIVLLFEDLIDIYNNKKKTKISITNPILPTAKQTFEEPDKTEKATIIENKYLEKNETSISSLWEKWIGTIRVVLCVVFLVFFLLLLRPVGFIIAGIFYLLVTFYVLTPIEKWKSAGLYILAVITPVLVYYLFVHVFQVLLPTGTIW